MTCERACRTCTHSGADPDGPYCAHPAVVKLYAYGRAIKDHNGVPGLCEEPALPLYTKDAQKRFFKKGES